MGLSWPIMFCSLEDGRDFGLLFPNHASGNNRLERRIIAANTRREPECSAEVTDRCLGGGFARTWDRAQAFLYEWRAADFTLPYGD